MGLDIKYKIGLYVLMFLLLILLIFSSKSILDMTGNVVSDSSLKYHEVNKQYTKSGVYLWRPLVNTTINKIEIDGDVFGVGDVEISLIKGGKKIVLFKRTTSTETVNVADYVQLSEGTDIGLTIKYGGGDWDPENDGVASVTDGIDFEIEPLLFYNFKKENLCTIWEVYSFENENFESTCYGAQMCCNFIGPSSSADGWDEDFVLVKGNVGSTANNIVLARIVFYNSTHTAYSNYDGLTARFVSGEITTKNVSGFETIFDSENYIIRVTLGNDTEFNFKGIKYGQEGDKIQGNDNLSVSDQPLDGQAEPLDSSQPSLPSEGNSGRHFQKKSFEGPFDIEISDDYVTSVKVTPPNYLENFEVDFSVETSDNFTRFVKFMPNYKYDAVMYIKVPEEKLVNTNLDFVSGKESFKPIFLRSDGKYSYFRASSKLTDFGIRFLEKEKNTTARIEEYSFFRQNSVYIFFILSLVVALVIFLVAGLDTPFNEMIKEKLEHIKWKKDLSRLKDMNANIKTDFNDVAAKAESELDELLSSIKKQPPTS